MLVDPSNSTVGSTVTGAIRQASQATGTSFNYLLATAQVESGLNPKAGAPTSSARGLFQFIDQTWLGTLKQSGAALGYGRYADAISQTASGQFYVADPAMRSDILKLRNDPTANALMAGAFTKSNADILSKKLGRAPSDGELYIAHFLGAGGAAHLITLAAGNPNANAADYFPIAARSNAPIFFDHSSGAPRTLAQVRNILTARYDIASRLQSGDAGLSTAAVATAPGFGASLADHAGAADGPAARESQTAALASRAAPDTAGMTSAFAAVAPVSATAADRHEQIFHGLFQDTDRSGPVAAVVSQLWTTPLGLPAAPEGLASRPPAAALRDLFSDPKQSG